MRDFKLTPKPFSPDTMKEKAKEYLASLSDKEIKELMKEVDQLKKDNKNK